MIIPTKKLKSGFELPVFGIGTFQIGVGLGSNQSQDNEDIKSLISAIDLGITHIDTAEIYSSGHSEDLIGEAIKGKSRSSLFITSKAFKSHLKYQDVLNSCKESLKRLGTDYLDLYLIHVPNPEIPLEGTIRAFDELVKQGLVKNIGVSNFNVAQLKEAQRLSKNKIVTNQIHYNLAYRAWQEVVDYCQKEDIFIVAYRPIERGVLTNPGIKILDEICQKYNKTQAQIAINWLISKHNVVTIAKTNNGDHLKENLGALNWEIEASDLEKLSKQFPKIEIPQPTIPLN